MATTLAALTTEAGVAISYVVAIEGYPYLLCSGDPSATIAAWTGTHWGSNVIGGASVSGKISQSMDPWRPFGEPTEITISVVPCPGQSAGDDRFGEDVWRRQGGVSSDLGVDINRTYSTAMTLRSTAGFPTDGIVYVGNEAIFYDSVSGNNLNVLLRGRYCPFSVDGGGAYAHPHTLSAVPLQGVKLRPTVSEHPRTWVGRWVGVWIHRRQGGVLDAKGEAHLAWAGRIRDVEETESGATVITCHDARASISDAVILRDQYVARVKEGLFVPAGTVFEGYTVRGTTVGEMNDLVVVASGASGASQINAGIYTAPQLASSINTWLAAERAAGRSLFHVSYSADYPTDEGKRPRILFNDPTSGSQWRTAALRCLTVGELADRLGWPGDTLHVNATTQTGSAFGPRAPFRVVVMTRQSFDGLTLNVEDERGTWIDQSAILPASLAGGGVWKGVLTITGFGGVMAYANGAGSFRYGPIEMGQYISDVDRPADLWEWGGLTVDDPGHIEVRQVLVAEGTATSLLRKMISSTGTASFNNIYDVLPEQLGCCVPHSLIDSLVDTDLVAMESGDALLTVVVSEPTKFSELFAADMILRKSFFVWRDGQIRLSSWQTPTAAYSAVTLDSSNKAAPTSHRDAMRPSVVDSDEHVRNIIKLRYGRDAAGGYAYSTTLEDAASVRMHGARPLTIDLRNVSNGESVLILDQMIAQFATWMPILSRPQIVVTRTMARTIFETATIGAQATVTDDHIRNWSTGARGVTGVPGLVISSWYDWGGAEHGEGGAPRVRPPMGEVSILVFPTHTGSYAPCAQVDDTQPNAGYDAAQTTLTCYAHIHSESTSAADASHFAAGDELRIVEIDPATAASPTTWIRTVSAVVGNGIKLTAALSSPSWDSAKKYRITYAGYASTQATQKTKSFQADDADGLVADTVAAFEYSTFTGGQGGTFTVAVPTTLPARHATTAYGDGVPYDVGYEHDIATYCNNLVSYKTAVQSPRVYSEERSFGASPGGVTWRMTDCGHIFVGVGTLPANKTRKLYVAPRIKVSAGTGTVRVSLVSASPHGDTYYDVRFPTPHVSASFSTTSTTYVVATASSLDIRHLMLFGGYGYLVIELDVNTSHTGLPVCYLGPLVDV